MAILGIVSLPDVAYAFLSILFEGLPFIFVGTLISGFIDAYLPPGVIDKWLPKNPLSAILVSGLLGIIFPVCECAIVPVIRRLIQKGLPVSCALTYMLAAPIINPVVVVSTMSAFWADNSLSLGFLSLKQPFMMTLSRLGIAYLITVLIGLAIQKLSVDRILKEALTKSLQKNAPETSKSGQAHSHEDQRVVIAMRTATRDFVETGMYFTIGVMITAVFNNLPKNYLEAVTGSEFTAIPAMMILAFLLSLCSTSDAFIAATLQYVSNAGKLAFLIFGPMMDVKLLFMYHSIFRGRFIFALGAALFALTAIFTYIWSLLVS